MDAQSRVPVKNLCAVQVILSLSFRRHEDTDLVQDSGNMAVTANCLWSPVCDCKDQRIFMSNLVHDVQHEFWRPPANQSVAEPVLADACRRCGTEFMVGAAFCHICGANRHRADTPPSQNWMKHFELVRALDFAKVRSWLGLPLPSLCAFLAGIVFVVVALSLGLMSVRDSADFEAIQLWRIQWLITACAAFLAGILLKSRKSEN
jgi:hypothetical protein